MGTITINGKKVEFTNEKNILTIIRKAGIEVPTLCYQPELSIFGACRLCTVEDDRGRCFASCSEEPRDGMVIYTHTERLRKHRKLIIELLLAAHCRDCTTCDKHGKCTPCREGTKRMLEILERIVNGEGKLEDLDTLEELAKMIQTMALCGLGKSAPLPVLSTLATFRDEYVEHIVDKKCRAKQCTALRKYVIDPNKCIGCSKCAKNCPVNAISGKIKQPFTIDPNVCIKCNACRENCAFGAIYVEA